MPEFIYEDLLPVGPDKTEYRLVSKDKLAEILKVVKTTGQGFAAKPIKDILGDDYSYGEIKAALEYNRRTGNQ